MLREYTTRQKAQVHNLLCTVPNYKPEIHGSSELFCGALGESSYFMESGDYGWFLDTEIEENGNTILVSPYELAPQGMDAVIRRVADVFSLQTMQSRPSVCLFGEHTDLLKTSRVYRYYKKARTACDFGVVTEIDQFNSICETLYPEHRSYWEKRTEYSVLTHLTDKTDPEINWFRQNFWHFLMFGVWYRGEPLAVITCDRTENSLRWIRTMRTERHPQYRIGHSCVMYLLEYCIIHGILLDLGLEMPYKVETWGNNDSLPLFITHELNLVRGSA